MVEAPLTRSARRERTRTAILEAARQSFAELGYSKTTIRAVAALAGYDPALVMQHFGSKKELLRAATSIDVDVDTALGDGSGDPVGRVLRHTFGRMDANPQAVASALRAILTHDEVAAEAFELFNPPAESLMRDHHGDPLSLLRARLLTALVLGTAINRYALKIPEVESVPLEELITGLRPAAEALMPPTGSVP